MLTELFGVLDFGSVGTEDGPIRVSNRWSLGLHRWSAELSEFMLFCKKSAGDEQKGKHFVAKSLVQKAEPKASARRFFDQVFDMGTSNWASVFASFDAVSRCLSAASKQPRERQQSCYPLTNASFMIGPESGRFHFSLGQPILGDLPLAIRHFARE